MNEFINNPILISAAGGLLAFISGIIGFFISSIRTYSKPMTRILWFRKDNVRLERSVEVDKELRELLSKVKSAVVPVYATTTLSELIFTIRLLNHWSYTRMILKTMLKSILIY